MLLRKSRGYLFAGDLVYKDTLFAYYPSTDPEAYLDSLEKVEALPVKNVFPAHHSLDIQPEILRWQENFIMAVAHLTMVIGEYGYKKLVIVEIIRIWH